eukprot:TRINITY_DN43601_c0_g1_i1.p2 TRINITY_DN43601_c0_g1~~TRINITY_DN43601_c0_g1_i1.p2  ORF type:complete len:200 (+),score=-3.78 TRINITY_DN43601_c0_g1_i1:29-601(+)
MLRSIISFIFVLLCISQVFAFGTCSANFLDSTSASGCIDACDGLGSYYPVQFSNIDISPYPVVSGVETTVSFTIKNGVFISGISAELAIESSPSFFLNQVLYIEDVCSYADLPAEDCQATPIPELSLSLPVTIPGLPLFQPGTYCGHITLFDLDGSILTCLAFNIDLEIQLFYYKQSYQHYNKQIKIQQL